MRSFVPAGWSVVVVVLAWGCGGSDSSPTSPTTNSITVNIVGSSGNQAFSPNPAQAASGTQVVWKNNTSDLHHLVMDNGSVIGNIASGASSAPTQVGAGGNYHCTNHPSMVGSINGTTAPTPPPGSGDGY